MASAAATGSTTVCVCYLKFETSQGRTLGPFDAGCASGSTTRYTLGSGLMYFSGAAGNLLDSLQVNYCTGGNCGTGKTELIAVFRLDLKSFYFTTKLFIVFCIENGMAVNNCALNASLFI
jgi:hypothetical protein